MAKAPRGNLPDNAEKVSTPVGKLPDNVEKVSTPVGKLPDNAEKVFTPVGKLPDNAEKVFTPVGKLPDTVERVSTPVGCHSDFNISRLKRPIIGNFPSLQGKGISLPPFGLSSRRRLTPPSREGN